MWFSIVFLCLCSFWILLANYLRVVIFFVIFTVLRFGRRLNTGSPFDKDLSAKNKYYLFFGRNTKTSGRGEYPGC